MGDFEEKGKWICIVICLVVAALVAAGLYQDFKLNVGLMGGIGIVLKAIGLFLLNLLGMAAIALIILIIAVLIMIAGADMIDTYKTVKVLKEELNLLKEDLATEIRERKKSDRENDEEFKRLSHNSDLLYRQTTELRKVTGLDVKKTELDAEKAILDSVQ
jgi:uncharacterized membrane protein